MQYFTLYTNNKVFSAKRNHEITDCDVNTERLEAFWLALSNGTESEVTIPMDSFWREFASEYYGFEGLPEFMWLTAESAINQGVNKEQLENAANELCSLIEKLLNEDRIIEKIKAKEIQEKAPITIERQQGGYEPHRTIEVRKGNILFLSLTWSAADKHGWDLTGNARNVPDDYGTMSQNEPKLVNEIYVLLQKAKCPSPKRTAKKAALKILAVRPKHSASYEHYGE